MVKDMITKDFFATEMIPVHGDRRDPYTRTDLASTSEHGTSTNTADKEKAMTDDQHLPDTPGIQKYLAEREAFHEQIRSIPNSTPEDQAAALLDLADNTYHSDDPIEAERYNPSPPKPGYTYFSPEEDKLAFCFTCQSLKLTRPLWDMLLCETCYNACTDPSFSDEPFWYRNRLARHGKRPAKVDEPEGTRDEGELPEWVRDLLHGPLL